MTSGSFDEILLVRLIQPNETLLSHLELTYLLRTV